MRQHLDRHVFLQGNHACWVLVTVMMPMHATYGAIQSNKNQRSRSAKIPPSHEKTQISIHCAPVNTLGNGNCQP